MNAQKSRSSASTNQTTPHRAGRAAMPTADSLFIKLLNSGALEEQTKKLEELSLSWLASQKSVLAQYRADA